LQDLFDSDYDESGKRSANDFAAFVQQAWREYSVQIVWDKPRLQELM
jgi:hypothetical protein